MKKALFFALLGLMTGLTSCQKDPNNTLPSDGAYSLTATIPQGIGTRAANDYGQGTKINRCILEIYRDGKLYGTRQVQPVTGNQVTFSNLQLVPSQTYDFVLWADCGNGTDDQYYNTTNLSAITVNQTHTGNDDGFDAFYAKKTIPVTEALSENITLRRPFGQLVVQTNDLDAIGNAQEDLKTEFVEIHFTSVPTTFNALTEEASNPQARSYKVAIDDKTTGDLIVDYILAAPQQAELADFTIDFQNINGTVITTNDNFHNIPIQRNYRTKVSGNLITKKGSLTVQINAGFVDDIFTPWDGQSAKAVTPTTREIEGVPTEVYAINEPAELAWIAQQVNAGSIDLNGKYIALDRDIDLGGHSWTPIANFDRSGTVGFNGTFDGQGHVISNLNGQNDNDDYGVGLFGIVYDGTVKNITISGGSLDAYDCAGAICGVMLGTSTLENCTSENVVVNAGSSSGGIAGRAYGTSNTLKNCINTSTVTGPGKCGGIVGIASNNGETIIENCTNNGRIYGGLAGSAGILGYAGPSTNHIVGCTNTGEIGSSTDKYSGGIVGYQAAAATNGLLIENSKNTGSISGIEAGGIYGIPGGNQPVTILQCTNEGIVNGVSRAGGIAARAGSGEITECVNTANVNAKMSDKGVAGGIVGDLGEAKIKLCQGGNASAVISAQYPGRLVGHVANKPYKPEDVEASLVIDDNNGDDYTTLRTIAAMGLYTSWSNINIEQGTLHGFPSIDGQASGYVKIHANAAWDQYPGETGVWHCHPSDDNQWTKDREL